jgi:hypothetical protein
LLRFSAGHVRGIDEDLSEALAAVPGQPNCVTVLALTPAGRISKIGYWDPDSKPLERFMS